MLKVFLDKLLLKNPSSARTTLKFETFFGKIGIEEPQFENDLEVFYQKVALKNPQFGQTILAVEACKESAIRGQNLRFYCQHLTEIFLSPLIVCSLQASRTTPRNFFGVVRPFCPKNPLYSFKIVPERDFLEKMSNWGFFKGSFWKKSLTSFKIVPELGLFNAIFGEKKILPDQFWQFWKNPLQVQVFKKKVSNFKAVLVELRFCSSSFPAQLFPRKIVELGFFKDQCFEKKSSRSFSNWGPSRPFFLQKMSHWGSSRPHLLEKQVELEIFSKPVFRRKTCLSSRSFSNRGSFCPVLASCLLPTKKTYKPHCLKSHVFFQARFFKKLGGPSQPSERAKKIADEGEEITLQPANASCH